MENKEYSAEECFAILKEKKQQITDEKILHIYDNCLELLNKYKITGQIKGMKKLLFHLECIEKEKEVIKMGINTFVYRDDIEDYIDNVSKDVIKIIELENYEREIPDEIVSVIEKVKDKFDKLYIVFTDYTGKVERRVEKEHRTPDPILFGTFQNEQTRTVIERFYFLGDWIDEYCDLTLDKMVNSIKLRKNKNIIHAIKTPKDIEELKIQLNQLENNKNNMFRKNEKIKKNIFQRIKSALVK